MGRLRAGTGPLGGSADRVSAVRAEVPAGDSSARGESASGSEAAGEPDEEIDQMDRFLCEECGDVIGVYEPLVMRTAEGERTTSRAAEPELRACDAAYLHRGCHVAAAAVILPRRAWRRA